MEFFEVIERRRSVRAFRRKALEPEDIDRILSAVNAAPSAGNLQAFEVYATSDLRQRKALAEAARGQQFVAEAPLVLVFCAHPERSSIKYGARGAHLYAVQDATIGCTFAMLAATALGLATVWVGAFDDEKVRAVVGDRGELLPVAILPVGYPAESPGPTSRRPLQDLVHPL